MCDCKNRDSGRHQIGCPEPNTDAAPTNVGTDPTTRDDPAASLDVACHRTITGNGSAWSWMDGPASLGALDNLRANPGWRIENAYVVDAPALLAGMDFLRERVRAVEEACSSQRARAEAAEQVAREAAALLREVRAFVDAFAALDGEPVPTPHENSMAGRISTFLAHHGARTGESNEA